MSSEELIMSKEKYPSTFLKPNGGFLSLLFFKYFSKYIFGESPVLVGAYSVT